MLILVRFSPSHRAAHEDRRRQDINIATSDGPITIKVMSIGGNRVEIGIDAPQSCRVLRGELVEA